MSYKSTCFQFISEHKLCFTVEDLGFHFVFSSQSRCWEAFPWQPFQQLLGFDKAISSGSWTYIFIPYIILKDSLLTHFWLHFPHLFLSPSPQLLSQLFEDLMFQPHHLKWHNSKLVVCRLYWYLQQHGFLLVLLLKATLFSLLWLPLQGLSGVDSEDARYQFYLCGRQIWVIVLHPQASNDSKHELLPRREEGCSEKNSFPPKVWTLYDVAGWNERAANQLLPFPLLTSRHCIPISHRAAIYNPHLQALLLKLQQQETLSQANRECSCLGHTTFLTQPSPTSREAAGLELRMFLPGWQHISTTLWCTWWRTETSRERPGVGQAMTPLLSITAVTALSQEWLIGSSQEEPSTQQSALVPSSINTHLFLSLQWTNTPHPSSAEPQKAPVHNTEKTHSPPKSLRQLYHQLHKTKQLFSH